MKPLSFSYRETLILEAALRGYLQSFDHPDVQAAVPGLFQETKTLLKRITEARQP